ncbi:glycoside hydrolase family 73 protein [Psychrobacter cibarius]|uniref:glycoside hydrolase family 73 protein n=1 Tax=Psychrobacter cibarius TaxID=282669 RepID=UPI0019198BC7|nr:glucosaminidase domain-containing protein [Psychrobacter cibarius]
MSYTYEDKLNFIVDIYCPIRKVSFETGMSWKTMLAQAAQETGWGEKVLPGTNNIFNIKLDSKWKGKTKVFRVWEGKKSSGRYENSKFPVFDTQEEAIYDRVDFLKRNPRYSKIFSKDILGNFEKEVQALEDAGYATHADEKTGELIYAELLIAVFGPTMRKAIARAEEKASCVITAAVFKKGVSGEPLANTKVLIKTDHNKYIDKKTNGKGIIEGITSNLNGSINFNLDSKEFSYSVANKRKLAIEVNITNDKFVTKTVNHLTADNKPIYESKSTTTNNSESSTADSKNSNNVTFNIKLVEADTGKPLPNTTYHLEYKNNIKPHKTDGSGIESGITADVSQSISVYLDDDSGKKQSIYSMAFPVIGDLNGQTKILKVPVVTLQLIFVDKNKKPVPNYEYKTVYRGRISEIKKANARGIATVKALAGQKLKIIHVAVNKFTSNIVTDGSTKWTYNTDKLIGDPSNSPSSTSNVATSTPSSSQKPDNTKPSATDKGNIIRNDKITPKGPTNEIKTDKAKITIKFLDEDTNKPLSGLTYWTQSTKYGKNASTTGSDGTRGRTHDSDVGVSIGVLVNENGKEVKKGTIVANSDKNGTAYVYKAKKPKIPNIEVKFKTQRTDVVTEKSKNILRELASQYGMKTIYITSTLRTPEEQASAMYSNIPSGKVIRYAAPGAKVTRICQSGIKKGLGRNKTIKDMVSRILEYDKKGMRVSKHCVSFETYAKKNIIDLGVNSNGLTTNAQKQRFQDICDVALNQGKLSSFISPLRDKAEPAFHLEIPQ